MAGHRHPTELEKQQQKPVNSTLTRCMTVESRVGATITHRTFTTASAYLLRKRLRARLVEIIIDSLLNRTTVSQRRGRSLGVFL